MVDFDFEKTFDAETYLYFYKDALSPERLKKEIDFLINFTGLNGSLDILDLACGFGRHANTLAALGFRVTGVDFMEGFLKIAKEEAAKLNLSVEYLQKDMRELNEIALYDRIFSLFTAIGYFDDEQNEKLFQSIFKALKPKGIFCFDSHNRDNYLTYYSKTTVIEKEGNVLIDRNNFDTLSGRAITKRTLIYKHQTTHFQYSVRLYNPTELTNLFQKIGFSNIEFYDNFEGKPLNPESKRMVVIATK